jgi:hypothetical protein
MKLTEVESCDLYSAKKDLSTFLEDGEYTLGSRVHSVMKKDAVHGYETLLAIIERLTSEPEPRTRPRVLDRPKRYPNRD